MLGLKNIDEKLMYKILSVPSFSRKEMKIQKYLLHYAEKNNIEAHRDKKGNVYMCKGQVEEGSFYPCLTAHMDTVQAAHLPFIDMNTCFRLETEERNDGQHIIYADYFGLGGDDKAGIVIALSIMEKLPICKAVFFVEEEIGCQGSQNADWNWFEDVGYVIAFDSPESNSASWSCWGDRLFDKAFYETYLEELGEKFGMTNFAAHPYTDVVMVRRNTSLACMNFGAGYHEYHSMHEYVVAEEMDKAVGIGIYLIDRLGKNKYIIPYISPQSDETDENVEYFNKKFECR